MRKRPGILQYETVLVTWLHNIDLHRVQDCGTRFVQVTQAVASNPILGKGTRHRVTFPSSITQEANVVAMTALWSIKRIRSNKYSRLCPLIPRLDKFQLGPLEQLFPARDYQCRSRIHMCERKRERERETMRFGWIKINLR